MSIVVRDLSKIYHSQKALNDISFTAKQGQILGLLGPNGAGKTTTMKILSCFMPATSGDVSVYGMDVNKHPLDIRQILGYLPEHNPLYFNMYIKEFLHFVAKIHKLDKPISKINKVIEQTGLGREQNKKISELSKGYKQRVGLAQAIIHDPKVLILDEPISGLDPNQLLEIRSLIESLKSDKTIIFSSHIMQEVESICDRVIILDKGELVEDNEVNVLTNSIANTQSIVVEFLNSIELNTLQSQIKLANINKENDKLYAINHNGSVDVRELLFDLAVSENNKILELRSVQGSLENVFKNVTNK